MFSASYFTTTLSVANLVYRELHGFWKEAVMGYLRYCSSICLKEAKKTTKEMSPGEIRTRYHPNSFEERYVTLRFKRSSKFPSAGRQHAAISCSLVSLRWQVAGDETLAEEGRRSCVFQRSLCS
jgi:hypothetical protein